MLILRRENLRLSGCAGAEALGIALAHSVNSPHVSWSITADHVDGLSSTVRSAPADREREVGLRPGIHGSRATRKEPGPGKRRLDRSIRLEIAYRLNRELTVTTVRQGPLLRH